MSSSRAISLGFGALLALSLGAKLALARAEPAPDQRLLADRATAFLKANGFAAAHAQRPLGVAIYATKGACRLAIREYDAHGTFAESHKIVARRIGPLHYVYRNRLSERAPKLLPLTEYFVGREARRVGLPVPRAPILAVAATPACPLAELDWSPLATLPR